MIICLLLCTLVPANLRHVNLSIVHPFCLFPIFQKGHKRNFFHVIYFSNAIHLKRNKNESKILNSRSVMVTFYFIYSQYPFLEANKKLSIFPPLLGARHDPLLELYCLQ